MRTDQFVRRRKFHQHRLEERDPALINLPIPVPSIPLLNPIVTPLIAGTPLSDIHPPTLFPHSSAHTAPVSVPPPPPPTPTPQSPPQEQPQPQPQSQTQPQPQPSSQPQPGPSSSPSPGHQPGSSGQQSSSGDGGGSGGDNHSSGQGGDGNTGNGSDGSGGGSNGASTSPGSSQGQPPANASPSLSPGDSNGGGSNTSIVTSTLTGANRKPTPIVIAGNSSNESGDSPDISPTDPQKPALNVGVNPNPTDAGADSFPFGDTTPSVTYSPMNPSETAYGSPGHGGTSTAGIHGNGQGGINGGGNNHGGPPEIGTSGATSPDPSHRGLSEGAVAAIAVIAALVSLGLLICACRRRAIARRISRRHWWSKSPYGPPISSSGYFKQYMAPSIRSSFGTNFEHEPIPSSPLPILSSSDWPLTPQTAQTAQTHATFPITFPPAMPTAASSPFLTIRSRDSGDSASFVSRHSFSSTSSDYAHLPGSQVVLIPARRDDVSEQWEHSPITSELGTPISVRPFSPSERWSFPKPPPHDRDPNRQRDGRPDAYPTTPSPTPDSINTSVYATAPESIDPFADPDGESTDVHTAESFTTSDTTDVHFAPQETVRRSFIPTLDDEIRVEPGDAVRVLKRFDDGWAYAENRNTGSVGLFPIDCLRMADQDLPAFLAAKRLSSYTQKPLSRRLSRMTAAQEHQAQL